MEGRPVLEVSDPAPASVRNPPVQKRSRELLEKVLVAAGEAFDEVGVDGCTMEEIARRAGVSIGAVYRFFSNRTAVVAALVERYGRQHGTAGVAEFTSDSLSRPAGEIIDEYFSAFAELIARQPGCRGLSRAGYLFGSTELAATWISDVERFLRSQVPGLPPSASTRSARTFTSLSGWLLLRAMDSGDAMEDGLREAATVMVGYVHELQRIHPSTSTDVTAPGVGEPGPVHSRPSQLSS